MPVFVSPMLSSCFNQSILNYFLQHLHYLLYHLQLHPDLLSSNLCQPLPDEFQLLDYIYFLYLIFLDFPPILKQHRYLYLKIIKNYYHFYSKHVQTYCCSNQDSFLTTCYSTSKKPIISMIIFILRFNYSFYTAK